MLANRQASAAKEQQCANAVATCSQAWVKTRAPFDFLKNVGLPNKYEVEDRCNFILLTIKASPYLRYVSMHYNNIHTFS